MELDPHAKVTSYDEIGVISINSDLVIVETNDEIINITGFKPEELEGKPIQILDPHTAQTLKTKGTPKAFAHYNTTINDNSGTPKRVECYLTTQKHSGSLGYTLFIKESVSPSIDASILEHIFMQAKKAFLITDNHGIIQAVNQHFTDITGYDDKEIIGKTPAILNSGRQSKNFYINFWKQLKTQGTWQGEIWNKRKNGEIFPEWLTISSIKNQQHQITHYIAQFSDLTNRKNSEKELYFQRYHDPLTHLPNRRLFFKKLNELIQENEKKTKYFAILFCDLDRFKLINDLLGHDIGDELLRSIADILAGKLRYNDIIGRSGGDEFFIVIESQKAIENIDKVCNQILALFEKPIMTPFGSFSTSISIGVSIFPHDSQDVTELLSFADSAMSKVKNTGGNNYAIFDDKEKTQITHKLELEREINQAIMNQEFELWYQPQIDSKNHVVYGVECLLRWKHPTQGLISPELFIPIAEANGTIKQLGLFVLQTACRQLKDWRKNDIFKGIMAINASIHQFEDNLFFNQIIQILQHENIPGNAIEIEVTESLFGQDNAYLIPLLSDLRKLGITIAIDDFGTGYSSLERLKKLPVDNVKIDKCFVDNIVDSPQDVSIVKAITLLSQSFGVNIIAEGIETKQQADKLKTLGCKNHQGYLYSKPLPAHEFEKWLFNFNASKNTINNRLKAL